MQRKSAFSRRLPDLVTEEIVTVLIENRKKPPLAWGVIFELMHARLKKRNAASGGEEMLRLRGYEKLKNLVDQNMVEKLGGKIPGQAKFKAKSTIENALVTVEPAPAGVNPDASKTDKSSAKKAPTKSVVSKATKPTASTVTKKKSVKAVTKATKAKPAPKKVAKVAAKVVAKNGLKTASKKKSR
jgi:hypothetical protein